MPVPTELVVKCKVCKTPRGDLNRWFVYRVEGTRFTFERFKEEFLDTFDHAVCGIEHLQVVVNEHAGQVNAVFPAGKR